MVPRKFKEGGKVLAAGFQLQAARLHLAQVSIQNEARTYRHGLHFKNLAGAHCKQLTATTTGGKALKLVANSYSPIANSLQPLM